MSEVPRYAKVPAAMSRSGWQRTAPHVATVGSLSGTASSVSGALDALASAIAEAANRDFTDSPAVWWDEANQVLWVSVPDVMHGGHRAFNVRMTPTGPELGYGTQAGDAPAAEAFSRAVGITRVEREARG